MARGHNQPRLVWSFPGMFTRCTGYLLNRNHTRVFKHPSLGMQPSWPLGEKTHLGTLQAIVIIIS